MDNGNLVPSEAQLRAAPLERLLDYGPAPADALCLRDLAGQGWSWSHAGLRLARAHLAASAAADQPGLTEVRQQHLLAAAVTANGARARAGCSPPRWPATFPWSAPAA